MKHLKLFNNESEYQSFTESADYVTPNVCAVKDGQGGVKKDFVFFNPEEYSESDFYNPNPNYLTIVALEDDCEISIERTGGGAIGVGPYYSLNSPDNWTSGEHVIINKGDYVSFKCYSYIGAVFHISKPVNLTGNCNSMIFGDNASTNLDLTGYANCYMSMFYSCPIVEISPTFLPATTLTNSCYYNMFYKCTSLTTAPQLPATTLAMYCYYGMFDGCSSLTTAPQLPAITLVDCCYESMFRGCTKLNYIKAMFTTTPSFEYTYNWVSGVASYGTFVKNKNATWNVAGMDGIPSGWAVVLEDPIH